MNDADGERGDFILNLSQVFLCFCFTLCFIDIIYLWNMTLTLSGSSNDLQRSSCNKREQ